MSRWPFVKLETLAEFKNGLNFSRDNWGKGLKVIGVGDFQDFRYPRYESLEQINPNGVVREADYLEEGDLLFVRSNGNRDLIGRTLYIKRLPEKISHSGFTIRLRFTSSKVFRPFYVYLFKSSIIRALLSVFGGGTNINNLNQQILRKLDVPLPPLVTQKKLAAVLLAYDELIENNRRRIELLEKLAEEIYREWFVRLRFPGHEKARVMKGVPSGWQVLPLSRLVSVNPAERIDKGGDIPFVGMQDLSMNSMFFVSKETRKGGQGAKFRNRDVLFPRITPSVENGKRGFVMTLADGQVGLGSTEFIVFRERVIGPEHIYFLTCSSDFRKHAELSMTGASGRQRVQEECFSFFLVKTPPPEIRQRFSEVVRPHFSQIHLLSRQVDHLTKTRDLLLPRLISGKLSLENLDIKFPLSMAEEAQSEQIATAHA